MDLLNPVFNYLKENRLRFILWFDFPKTIISN